MTIRLDSDLGISASGNVTGNYIIGDGSQLTNISSSYGNANVAAYLPTYTGNLVALGFVQAETIAANANVVATNIISTTETVSGNLQAGNLSAVGNVVAAGVKTNNYLYANGTPVSFDGTYSNTNVQSLLNSGAFTGDIIPAGNATQSLGNATNQWLDLWVSNSTIYLNSIPLGVSAGGVLQFDGNDIVTSGANVINTGNIDTSGDIIGGNLIVAAGGGVTFADGSIQTSAYGDVEVETYLPSSPTILAINATVANTDANVAALNLTVANLATAGSLANTDANVANLTTALGNTDSNVANLTTSLGNTDSNVANLTTAVSNTDSNVANLVTVTTNTDSNVANLTTALANTDSELSNVSNAVITLSQSTTDAFANTNSNVANVASDLANTDSSLGNLTITVGNQANAIANLQGATYSNANVDSYLPIYTGNIGADILTATILVGEGGNISNITGANVTGEVALANTVTNPLQPNITALGTITSLTAGAVQVNGLFTANAGAQFNGNVLFTGNVTLPGNINQISGNSATFFGDPATGFGALYAGLLSGYTPLGQEVVQFADNFNSYAQVSHQNINGGDQATTDYVATAGNGTDTTNFVDLGVAGGGYNGALANNSLGTSLFANDGYLYAKGNVTGGNLVLGSKQIGGVVRIIANGVSNIGDVVATFSGAGLEIGSITAQGGSPAPVISGFRFSGISANITGNVSGGNIVTVGNVAGNFFLGNGSQLTGLDSSPAIASINSAIANTDSNVANLTTSLGNTDANVANLTTSLGNTDINVANLNTALANTDSNVATLTTALGNTDSSVANLVTITTNTDSNVANLTTALGNTDANVATLQGQVYANANVFSYLASSSNVEIVTTGNISGGFILGDGSQLTNLPGGTANIIENGTTNVSIPAADGNAVITVNNGPVWTFNTDGTLVLPPTGTAAIEGTDAEDVRIRAVSISDPVSASLQNYNGNTTTTSVSANPDTVTVNANSNTWTFDDAGGFSLAETNVSGSAGEAAKFVGTRKIVNGIGFTTPYAVALTGDGSPTVAYTASSGVQSTRVTFVVQSSGTGFNWEQFDVVATPSQDTPGTVNYVVSNRIKALSTIPDTQVTATMNGTNQIEISLTLDVLQTNGGTASFDAVEFGLMID